MKLVNAQRKVQLLRKFIHPGMKILDFGCGDLLFARELQKAMPTLEVTGVDVIDFGIVADGIIYKQYDGRTLPFANASFDAVISYHVFHHTNNPFVLLQECFRVSKRTVLFVEPVYRGRWDIPGMRFMDWVFNVWKDRSISMPYAFASEKLWKKEIIRTRAICKQIIDVEILPKWLPTGRSLLFVCQKIHPSR